MRESLAQKAADVTTSIHIGDSDFTIQPEGSIIITPLRDSERFLPATVIYCDDTTHFGAAELDEVRDEFRKDDVWTEDFLELLIIQYSGTLTVSEHIAHQAVQFAKGEERIPVGPYVIHTSTGSVHSVFKLFEDTSNAFVRGTLPETGTDRHRWLVSIDRIPVPSRLYYSQPNDLLPLRGMRFGVKDSIDIAGLETGCGSRCYQSFCPAKSASAACVSQLVSAGAIMVGKMRCYQWCDGQDPLERFEEVSPTNPRGDTFQKPSSSSSGSAAGAASYAWLDFTIGTDTGGSIRHPASVNGVYGMRPSLGSIPSSGLVCSQYMDTPGVFARSAAITRAVTRAMAYQTSADGAAKLERKIQYKLLYAVEPELLDAHGTAKFFHRGEKVPDTKTSTSVVFEEFVKKLEKYLNCKRQEVCLYDLWRDTRPKTAPESLVEATEMIYQNVVYYELWHSIVGPFVQEYQGAHSGRMPFIEPITKARLDYGSKVSRTDYDRSVTALRTYATWVNEVLLPPASSTSGTETDTVIIPLLIYPQSWGVPRYRDEVVSRTGGNIFWKGFSPYSISYCSGCPDVTVPIGEARFHSRITNTDEYLPVAVSLLAPRGEDELLLRLLEDLEKEKILREVGCGSRLWSKD
ncbi:amidase signature domain-containing protein [Hypoxylon cercidicola]|nr:amidase signature domain-containing protein [Hypoxylon cercidicola]